LARSQTLTRRWWERATGKEHKTPTEREGGPEAMGYIGGKSPR